MSVNELRPEVPRNGIQGLKHWKFDIVAGLLVSIVSLPLSLGIAVASGAPPITGLTSAIIAGAIVPFIGGTYVTISGPAAGLAPALLTGMLTLGEGDRVKGYPLLLAVIMIVGSIQIVLSLLKAARISSIFPSVVVEGMLASIGLLIIAKQLPYLMGSKFQAHTFFEYLMELPAGLRKADPSVLFLGMSSVALMFVLAGSKNPLARKVPPQLIVVVLGVLAGIVLGLKGDYLIHLPDDVLEHGITAPDFAGLLARKNLYFVAFLTVVTLTLIDGVESLATAAAIDRIDPFHRKSDPNRTLLAMGVCNIASSMAGGLTIIPGGVKSKACIVAGGRTLWANLYNAVFLVLYLSLFKSIINQIPYTILASILIYTGYRMCEPKIWRHIAKIGPDQTFLFVATILTTLLTDLLIGILVGTALKLCVALYFDMRMERDFEGKAMPIGKAVRRLPSRARAMFRNPLVSAAKQGESLDLHFGGPVVCFNSFALSKAIESIPADVKRLRLFIDEEVSVIDPTSLEILQQFENEIKREGVTQVEIIGLDRMKSLSSHTSSFRLGYRYPTVSND